MKNQWLFMIAESVILDCGWPGMTEQDMLYLLSSNGIRPSAIYLWLDKLKGILK